jgi:hypothetical protein
MTNKDKAVIAIAEVEEGKATLLHSRNSENVYASESYPNLCVYVRFTFDSNKPHLKPLHCKARLQFKRAVANIVLHAQGLAPETFLIESDQGLYLVTERLRAAEDDVDVTALNEAVSKVKDVALERPLTAAHVGYTEANELVVGYPAKFVVTPASIPLEVLSPYIDLKTPLDDARLRDESLWIQDGYFAVMDIIKNRTWMRYFIDGHFETMFSDLTPGEVFFQTQYNYTLLSTMRELAKSAEAKTLSLSEPDGQSK